MRVLLFGPGGQIGTEIRRRAPARSFTIIAAARSAADLARPGEAAALIGATACDLVVNAAAYTAVDQAESEPDLAEAVNARAPGEMARAAAKKRVSFIHLSTDYVFDGAAAHPYRETDLPAPLNVYGATKLRGEESVAEAGGAYAILRHSWVFSAHRTNFVKTMLKSGAERDIVQVVADQRAKPTPAAAAAEAILAVAAGLAADPDKSGLYHFAGDEAVSWAEFAEAIFREARLEAAVERIESKDFPRPARRPASSALDMTKIGRAFGIAAPSWRRGLKDVIRELKMERAG
jgi:dTDP-4-dehydrorhamnose reductase